MIRPRRLRRGRIGCGRMEPGLVAGLGFNPHAVEGFVDEEDRDQEEGHGQDGGEQRIAGVEGDGELDGEQAE